MLTGAANGQEMGARVAHTMEDPGEVLVEVAAAALAVVFAAAAAQPASGLEADAATGSALTWEQGAVGLAAAPELQGMSATSQPGPYKIQNKTNGNCLDSNRAGNVYWGKCLASDSGQKWIIWNGGWTKSMLSGSCLEQTNGWEAWLAPCVDRPSQHWRHWDGGWYQSVSSGRCIKHSWVGYQIQTDTCLHHDYFLNEVDLW